MDRIGDLPNTTIVASSSAGQLERVELRLTPEHRRIIEQAAVARGHSSLSGFVAVELLQVALKILNEQQATVLTDRDRDLFLAILDGREPNEALRRAAERYLGSSH